MTCKIVVDRVALEQVVYFSYLSCIMHFDEELNIKHKTNRFRSAFSS